MGVKDVDWFHSYLTGRQQLVSIGRVQSNLRSISSGVPQGSILGPLLYLCYVNDFHNYIGCKMLLYADDSALLVSDKDPDVVTTKLAQELSNCNNWLVSNKLSMHMGKTEFIMFGAKKKLRRIN